MTGLPADAWVPVSLRWRHVVAGDVFVAPDGELWLVHAAQALPDGTFRVVADRGADEYGRPVDPDDVISVLVPVSLRDAVELTREQLGARLVERRTDPLPSDART